MHAGTQCTPHTVPSRAFRLKIFDTLFADNGCPIFFYRKNKLNWERVDFIQIKKPFSVTSAWTITSPLSRLPGNSLWYEGKEKVSGEGWRLWGRRRTNKPIPHSCFHLSLLPVEQIGVCYIVIENKEGKTKKRERKQERWMRARKKRDNDKTARKCL